MDGGSRYVDISKMNSNEEKIDFIRNNTELLNNGYSGFVIEKKVNSSSFTNDHSYNKNAFLLNGLVIINKLSESVFHGTVAMEINRIILNYYNTYGYIGASGSADVIINENTVYNPDGSFEILPSQFPRRVLLVFEVNYNKLQSKKEAFNKCRRFFGNGSINIVILLCLYSLGVGCVQSGHHKLCAVVFDRTFSIVDPLKIIIIISFGSQKFTESDIRKYRNLSNNNNTPITGSLFNNDNVNNAPNNPIYTITIQPNSLFFQNPPFPNNPPVLVIDLFTVKQKIDSISIFKLIKFFLILF
ncbi:hypothetical protein ACTFIR_002566 [Dictyostelium discoideum]